MNEHDARARVTELIRGARVCMLTTLTGNGRQVSRPMGLQHAEFDGYLWFFAYEDSPKVAEIALHPQVNITLMAAGNNGWVSISGHGEILNDRARAERLWHPFLTAWFPDGLDTLGLTLIRVRPESIDYWDAPGARGTSLIPPRSRAAADDLAPAGDRVKVNAQ